MRMSARVCMCAWVRVYVWLRVFGHACAYPIMSACTYFHYMTRDVPNNILEKNIHYSTHADLKSY